MHWIHIKCNGTTANEYKEMMYNNSLLSVDEITKAKWNCNECIILNMANIFPFGLENDYALESIMNCGNLKS